MSVEFNKEAMLSGLEDGEFKDYLGKKLDTLFIDVTDEQEELMILGIAAFERDALSVGITSVLLLYRDLLLEVKGLRRSNDALASLLAEKIENE